MPRSPRSDPVGPSSLADSPTHQRLVTDLCRHIDALQTPPTLAELARRAGYSPWHLQRVFKAVTGLSPSAYARARRAERLRETLRVSPTVSDAAYGAGYQASSRFYAEAPRRLGMSPSSLRAGGRGERIHFALGQCALGSILVASTARGICTISLGDDPQALLDELQARFSRADLQAGDAQFHTLVARVVGLVERPRHDPTLPLDIRGTVFQQRVWDALRRVPTGQTLSYAQLAEGIGAPSAVRAVASACAANVLAVAIPCHRVVRTDGGLGGYRWGVARKQALLDMEATALSKDVPATAPATAGSRAARRRQG